MKINQFKTKTALTNYTKYILNKNDLGTLKNLQEIKFLKELVKNHYNSDFLIGTGIDEFFITKCEINANNKKFNILRVDKSVVDFSYKKAISGKEPKHISYVKRAFRLIVRPQTNQFKQDYFYKNKDSNGHIKCEISGLKFKINECHIDHKPPLTFDFIFNSFLKFYKINPNEIPFEKTGLDNRPIILDSNIIKTFFDYHYKNCDLRPLYWRANLQLPKK